MIDTNRKASTFKREEMSMDDYFREMQICRDQYGAHYTESPIELSGTAMMHQAHQTAHTYLIHAVRDIEEVMGKGAAEKYPQIVQPEQVIDVVVRVEDRVDEFDVRAEQLQAEFGRRVDQDVAARRADDHGAAVAVVPRVGRPADGTLAPNHGYADGRAGAEERERARFCREVNHRGISHAD
jgi:hypothetical protein